MKIIGEKISIIVPIYNAELYLQKCIKSILNQTYSNIQVILIDDGSTDNSGNICDTYSKQDNRIEVYHTENNGLVAARKLGLKVSVGKYIGFVDADDYIEPTTFSELKDAIKKNNSDFVHFGFIEENFKNSVAVCNYYDAIFEMKDKYDQINFLCAHILEQTDVSPSIWSKLFKADFIKKCYKNVPDKQQYGEDMICLCYCILEANRIYLSKKTRYHYVVRANSLSHLDNREYVINEVKLWNCILNVLDEYECADLTRKGIFSFFKKRIFYSIEQISEKRVRMPRYYFTNIKEIYGKSIIIYGAGNVGQDYYAQICGFNKCKIVAWVDAQWYKCGINYFEIVGLEKIKNMKFDLILIAVADVQIKEEIKNTLMHEGYLESKMYWEKPKEYF